MTQQYINKFKEKNGHLPSQKQLTDHLKISQKKAIGALIEYTRTPTKERVPEVEKKVHVPINTVLVLKIALILLSAMAFTLSVYFTGLWFSGKFSLVISGLISLSMVLFMVISPQVIRYVNNPFVKAVTVLCFTIALLFSMGSTIAGQYQKITERIEAEPDKAYIFAQQVSSEQELLGMIEEAQEDKKIHQTTISLLSSTEEKRLKNWQSIATERKYITAFNERIDVLRTELNNVRKDQVENGIIEEKRDFYLFISGLTGMEKSFTEFLVSALPAIFIDIISALCLNLALFIGKGK